MSLKYIREIYGVPAKRNARVKYQPGDKGENTRFGVITSANGTYLRIRFDGEEKVHPAPFHPLWKITYLSN